MSAESKVTGSVVLKGAAGGDACSVHGNGEGAIHKGVGLFLRGWAGAGLTEKNTEYHRNSKMDAFNDGVGTRVVRSDRAGSNAGLAERDLEVMAKELGAVVVKACLRSGVAAEPVHVK